MAFRMWPPLALVAVGFCLGTTADALGQGRNHPGQVIEYGTRKPLEVSVKAWPQSVQKGKDGNCPIYGDAPLDAATSNKEGKFKLSIDGGKRTYTTVYCTSGYVPRTDPDVPNDEDGSQIMPTPVFLWPAQGAAASGPGSLNDASRRRTIAALNDLAYLYRIDSGKFSEALGALASDISGSSGKRAGIVSDLAKMIQAWSE